MGGQRAEERTKRTILVFQIANFFQLIFLNFFIVIILLIVVIVDGSHNLQRFPSSCLGKVIKELLLLPSSRSPFLLLLKRVGGLDRRFLGVRYGEQGEVGFALYNRCPGRRRGVLYGPFIGLA